MKLWRPAALVTVAGRSTDAALLDALAGAAMGLRDRFDGAQRRQLRETLGARLPADFADAAVVDEPPLETAAPPPVVAAAASSVDHRAVAAARVFAGQVAGKPLGVGRRVLYPGAPLANTGGGGGLSSLGHFSTGLGADFLFDLTPIARF